MTLIKFLRRHWRLAVFIIVIMSIAIASRLPAIRGLLTSTSISSVREEILALGWQGVALYMFFYIGLVTLGLPNLPFQLAAAAIYGFWKAFIMMYLGVNIGALTAFAFARMMGRKSLEALLGHRLSGLNQKIGRGGFRFLLVLRLIPLMPFNLINYASGLSRISVKDYIASGVLGMLPLTLLHVAFGSAAASISLSDPTTWTSPKIFLPILGVFFSFLVAIKYKKKSPTRDLTDSFH